MMSRTATLAAWILAGSGAMAVEPFEDATRSLGLEGLSGSVAAWVDFNQDRWVDLYVGGQLWRNEQGKRFSRVEGTPLSGDGVWGDFNNDGHLDLFSWSGGGKLFRNLSGKSFELMPDAIPELPTAVSLAATWGDFNGDGYLDLYVGGYEVWPSKEYPDVLLINRQGKRFEEKWRQKTIRRARGISAADFDQDGDLDVYVSNYRLQPNGLWRNDGKANFADVAAALGVAGDGHLGAWGHTIGSAWGDLDNDGLLDLFVGNFSHPPAYQDRPQFLKNLGEKRQYRFEDRSTTAGLRWQESYASPALGDFDNDGRLDLYFTTVYAGDKSVLYRNVGDWRFEEVTAKSGISVQRSYQAAWADYDNDGDLDLVSGGRLFRNTGNASHWLRVRLDSPGANCASIGAQVRIKLGNSTLTRQVEGASGQGNQNDLTLHFGLNQQHDAVGLEVSWPDGTRQTVRSAVDREVTITKN